MHVDDVSCLFLHVCTDSLFYLTGNIHANRPTVGLKSHSHSQEFKIVPLSSGDGWPNHRVKRCLIAPVPRAWPEKLLGRVGFCWQRERVNGLRRGRCEVGWAVSPVSLRAFMASAYVLVHLLQRITDRQARSTLRSFFPTSELVFSVCQQKI